MDQNIFTLTNADEMEEEMKTADETNVVVKDALTLTQHRINVMRWQVVALNPNLRPAAQQDPVDAPVRATNRPKISLPWFNPS